jgi:hypothetical protein
MVNGHDHFEVSPFLTTFFIDIKLNITIQVRSGEGTEAQRETDLLLW